MRSDVEIALVRKDIERIREKLDRKDLIIGELIKKVVVLEDKIGKLQVSSSCVGRVLY